MATKSQTVNITIPKVLLEQVDELARRDYTSRSDIIRQALLHELRQARRPITLDDLLTGMTPEHTAEDKAWLNMKPAGKEIIKDDYSIPTK